MVDGIAALTNLLASLVLPSLLLLVYYGVRGWRSKRSRLHAGSSPSLPPGPKGRWYPIVGNLFDIPPKFEWVKYHQWCKEIGSDIIYVNIAGMDVVVLDSFEVATELLERRSSIYSSRTRQPMITELMEWNFHFAFIPYGDQWRSQRKLMHQVFHTTAAKKLHPYLLKATHGLLRRILDTGPKLENIMGELRYMAGEAIMSIAYGLDVEPKNDPYIQVAEEGQRGITAAALPGAFWVDSLPILKYVPEWFPGAGFQKKAKAWKIAGQIMTEMPFAAAKERINSGNFKPSFVSYSFSHAKEEDFSWQEPLIKKTAASMYSAGSDTTVSAIASCIIGLLNHPDILKRAQEEIDSVIAFGDLPTFDEENKLPIVTAICMEAIRWRVVAPIAVPHLLTQDDVYKGYILPRGTIVVPNVWAMLHNEEIYPDPFLFKPDRFLKDGRIDEAVLDPSNVAFGFGRRICPGQSMAFSAIWITIATLIAAFDITKAVDENGDIIEADPEYLSALVCLPKPFTCAMKPRSKAHARAIQATAGQEYAQEL